MKKIELSKFGVELRTRKIAQEIRAGIDLSQEVEFDVKDVSIMTHSFADELFGGLFDSLGKSEFSKKILLKNFNPEHATILKRVIQSHIESSGYLEQL